MGGAYSMCVGELHTGFWRDNMSEKDHLDDLGVDGRIILNGYSRSGMERLYDSK
jgi:hypothetical protein